MTIGTLTKWIPRKDFNQLFFKPIFTKKVQLRLRSPWKLNEKHIHKHTKRLSEVYFAEYFPDAKPQCFYVDHEHRKKYFGERAFAGSRELAYRLVQKKQLQQAKPTMMLNTKPSKLMLKDDFQSEFAFWVTKHSNQQRSRSCVVKNITSAKILR